jgi:hypothetical protein
MMYLAPSVSVLTSTGKEGRGQSSVAFQLPKKPFFSDVELYRQHLFASLSPFIGFQEDESTTFVTPFIPELNEFYGRKVHFGWNEVRAESEGIGILTKVTRDHLKINALPTQQLISKVFEVFGIAAEMSEPGRIARRMIEQLGGIQGCRVFKISGVRKLIGDYGPLESFTRSGAIQIIGNNDPSTGIPRFSQYEDLFIEYRESRKLKPQDALEFLLKKGVFRVGLALKCPVCELSFWTHLDAVKTTAECELCGAEFNVTPQLRDRDWAYRRSGLFGRTDHQLGSIPVALTLQQLHTILGPEMIYTTAMNLAPLTARVNKCETDFVVLAQKNTWQSDKPQLAIGEAKDDGGEITDADVANLILIADSLPKRRLETYIVFAKTSSFRPDEIERCKRAQEEYRNRVILLSGRELEPYHVYERTAEEFEIDSSAISLEDLATATRNIYFDPRPKRLHEPIVEPTNSEPST